MILWEHDQENLKFQSRKDGFKLFSVTLAIIDFIIHFLLRALVTLVGRQNRMRSLWRKKLHLTIVSGLFIFFPIWWSEEIFLLWNLEFWTSDKYSV